MFNKLKNMASDLFDAGESIITRAMDKSTFTRVVYASYLIADADGNFDANERAALAKFINKEMPQFDITDVIKTISECEKKVAFDKDLGTMELLDEISKADGDDAKLIMRVCCFIGKADGSFDQDEKLMARSIATKLKLPLSDYGL